MTREEVVEQIAEIERELSVPGQTISDDSLVVMWRNLEVLEGHATRHSLPTTKIEALFVQLESLMSDDAMERVSGPTAGGQPIKSQTWDELHAELMAKSGGGPINIISNPVNPDGSLTPEAQAALAAQGVDPATIDPNAASSQVHANDPSADEAGGKPSVPERPRKSHDELKSDISDLFGGDL